MGQIGYGVQFPEQSCPHEQSTTKGSAMTWYDVTVELPDDRQLSAITIGLVPAYTPEEAEHTARLRLQDNGYTLGSLVSIEEQPASSGRAWGHLHGIPRHVRHS